MTIISAWTWSASLRYAMLRHASTVRMPSLVSWTRQRLSSGAKHNSIPIVPHSPSTYIKKMLGEVLMVTRPVHSDDEEVRTSCPTCFNNHIPFPIPLTRTSPLLYYYYSNSMPRKSLPLIFRISRTIKFRPGRPSFLV